MKFKQWWVYDCYGTTDLTPFIACVFFSGEGSHQSSNGEERTFVTMARAVAVHPDSLKVMYYA